MKLLKSLSEIKVNEKLFPVFFQDAWLNFQREKSEVFIYCDDNNQLLIPFTITPGKVLMIGKYIYKPLTYKGNSVESEKECLSIFHLFLKKKKLCHVIFPPIHVCVFKELPKKVSFYSLGIISVDLRKEEDLLLDMKKNYIRQIKKAIKEQVTVDFGPNQLDSFYKLYKDTHQRQGLPYETEFEINSLNSYLFDNMMFGASAYQGSAESGFCNLYDDKSAYYLYGGSAGKLKSHGSNKFLFWQTMLHFKEKGCDKFVLGGFRPDVEEGSKHDGMQQFKINFGAQVEKGYHFYKVLSPIRFLLFRCLLALKSLITNRDLFPINREGISIKSN